MTRSTPTAPLPFRPPLRRRRSRLRAAELLAGHPLTGHREAQQDGRRDRPCRGPSAGLRRAAALLALALALALPAAARADGKAFGRHDYTSSFQPVGQSEQNAVIAHTDGVETLTVAVNLDLADDQMGLWLLPVPGTPDTVTLDLVDAFPQIEGTDHLANARDAAGALSSAARVPLIVPSLLEALLLPALGGGAGGGYGVHATVDRWGVRAELVTADSVDGLAAYLTGRGDHFEPAELSPFASYLTGDHVLVSVAIASSGQVRREFADAGGFGGPAGRWPCVRVRFPTDRAYYPMRPTASYESRPLASLTVLGSVRPVTDGGGTPGRAWVSLRWAGAAGGPDRARTAAGLPAGPFAYTFLQTYDYSEDLWFEPVPEPPTAYARLLGYAHDPLVGLPVAVLYVALLSYLAGGITGLITCGRWRTCAPLGLYNLATVVAVVFAVRYVKGDVGDAIRRGRGKGFLRITFSDVFLCVYFGLTIAGHLVLRLPVGVL